MYYNTYYMPTNKSPLRYPGGKTRAISLLETHVKPHYKTIISPFFGGGSFELHLKSLGYKIYGNDLFSPLYTFWSVCQRRNEDLEHKIRSLMPITKERFSNLRETIGKLTDEVEIAAAYYCVNRCSFSGATFCGGFSKEASTGRLNDAAIKRLRSVDLSDIVFSNKDCIAFLEDYPETKETLVYADPPYYISTYIYGKDGDMHESFDHAAFAKAIKKRGDWILCYNDCDYIRDLYSDCIIEKVAWSYGMNAKKKSSEILIRKSA